MQIIVFGMHRSGTSAVTRLINMMGASVGPAELVGKPAADNLKGFWECSDVRTLNDELLAACGASWDDPWSFSENRLSDEQREVFLQRIRDIVFLFDTRRPWVFKDPRLSITFSLWRPFLEAPLCVLPLRHPDAVAESLWQRNSLPRQLSQALWELYTCRALQQSVDLPLVRVDFERLVEEPVALTSNLYVELCDAGATGLRLPAEREVRAFVDSKLRHHQTRLNDNLSMDGTVRSLYHRLIVSQERVTSDALALSTEAEELLRWQNEHRQRLQETEAKLQAAQRETEGKLQAAQRETEEKLEAERRETKERQGAEGREAEREIERQRQQILETEQRFIEEIRKLQNDCQQCEQRMIAAQERTPEHSIKHGVANLLGSLQLQSSADVQQLAHWLDDALGMMRASFGSMRWRTGDLVCSVLERMMLRGRPRLARAHIEQIERDFRLWWHKHLGQQEIHQALTGMLLESATPSAAVSLSTDVSDHLETMPRSLSVPVKSGDTFDVLCFPVIDWHFRMQRPQHIARGIGSKGHRVFYLCTHPTVSCAEPGFDVFESPESNVWLVRLRITLDKAPNLYREPLQGAVLEDYISALDRLREALAIVTPIAIVDLPFWRPLVESLPGSVLIYDCMDHHAGFSTNTEKMLAEESLLLDSADAVVVTSRWLEQKIGRQRSVRLIRNGADVQRFANPSETLPQLSEHPVIGYIGAISDWFDIALVEQAAKALPEVNFVLVGDVTVIDTKRAIRLSNVRFIGEVPYERAAAYVHAFDVCIIPFLINDLTCATNPVKVYEYLAAGKPVVATALPELCEMDDLVRIAEDQSTFIKHLRSALDDRSNHIAEQRRRQWAQAHDWRQRTDTFEDLIRELLPKASVVVLAWNNIEFTRSCLESLERYTDYPDWELILVDNGSTDGTPEFFRNYAARQAHVKLVLNEHNLGFAAGMNAGFRIAEGEVVVALNNDIYVTPGWLAGLVRHLQRNPELGIIGPVTNNIGNEAKIEINYTSMEEMLQKSRDWTRRNPRQLAESEVVAFFCCAIPREILDEIGLLDEDFGQGFFEDDDYCRRIRATGRRVAIADDIFIHHHLSASFNILKEERRRELFEHNRMIYERKWGKWKPHGYRKQA